MPKPVLEDYQIQCRNFIMQHPKCGVFLNIGYGKTLTTIDAVDTINSICVKNNKKKCIRNTLIVAPKAIARTTWHAEVEKWGYNINVYSMVERYNPKKQKMELIKLKELYNLYPVICHTSPDSTNFFITTRDRVAHLADWCEENNNWPFDMIVCDEFQSFKSGNSERTQAIMKLAAHTYRLVGLTGTPMPNSLEDVWSEIRILDGGKRLGRFITHFREKYEHSTMVVNGHSVGWKANPGAEDEVFNKIRDIAISVKTDLKLPPLTINDVYINLDEFEMNIYKKFASRHVLDLEEIDKFAAFKSGLEDTKIVPANAAVLSGKLLQLASGTIYDDFHNTYVVHNQKLAMLQYIVDNTGGNILVAYHFKCDEERILNTIDPGKDEKIVKFDGSNEMKEAWNRGEYKVMLIQPQSTCHGVNLQDGGFTLVWYSIPWSLEHYDQTIGRLFRKGQTKPVVVHRLIAKNTFDERVARGLSAKSLSNETLLEMVRREINGVQ